MTFGVVFGKDVFLGQMRFLACVEKYVLWVLCIGHASCILFEFYVFFYLVVFGFYLPAVPLLVP